MGRARLGGDRLSLRILQACGSGGWLVSRVAEINQLDQVVWIRVSHRLGRGGTERSAAQEAALRSRESTNAVPLLLFGLVSKNRIQPWWVGPGVALVSVAAPAGVWVRMAKPESIRKASEGEAPAWLINCKSQATSDTGLHLQTVLE